VTRLRILPAVGLAIGIASFAVATVLALTDNERPGLLNLPLASPPGLGRLRPAAAAGPLGPEYVPMPAAPSLAPAGLITNGEQIDGITCQAGTTVLFTSTRT